MMSKARKDSNLVIQHVIDSIYPSNAVSAFLSLKESSLKVGVSHLDLSQFSSIHVLACGKAACAMASAVESILGDRINGGLVCTNRDGFVQNLRILPLLLGAHPIPDKDSVKCAEESLRIASGLTGNDLLIVLISGGGSSIWCSPIDGLTLADKRSLTSKLLDCAATIEELNIVRRHLSRIKGGRLAEAAHPAKVVSLVLSDVIGDDLPSIASGPTVGNPSTFADAIDVIEKYKLSRSIPANALELLKAGKDGKIPETPKYTSKNDIQVIVGSNKTAKEAAESLGPCLGYNTYVIQDPIMGEARDAAKPLCGIAKEIQAGNGPVKPPAMIIAGGETTVRVRGNGTGGRNQEMALAAAIELQGTDNILFLSFGTDGIDGPTPTDAAGAFADSTTVQRALESGLHVQAYLDNNDSYSFFKKLGDQIITGPTGSNVMDVQIMIIE